MQHLTQKDQLPHTTTSVQFALKLSRPHQDNTSLDGDLMSEKEMYATVRSSGDRLVLGFLNNYKTQLLVYFGKPLEAVERSDESSDFGVSVGMGTAFISRFYFFTGIANLRAYEIKKQRKYIRKARAMKNFLKALVVIYKDNNILCSSTRYQ